MNAPEERVEPYCDWSAVKLTAESQIEAGFIQRQHWTNETMLASLAQSADLAREVEELRRERNKKWIACSERLPDQRFDDEYIVLSSTGYRTSLHYNSTTGWYSSEETAKDGYWNGFITHWQPFPEAALAPAPEAHAQQQFPSVWYEDTYELTDLVKSLLMAAPEAPNEDA